MVGPPSQRGRLSPGWTVLFALGWLGVAIGMAAVWGVSRQLGLSTWWLGPKAQPRSMAITMLPFVPSALLIAGAAAGIRHLWWSGLAGAVAIAGVAAGDLGRVTGIAVVEFAVAGSAALLSLAAWSGTYLADDLTDHGLVDDLAR